MLHKNKEIKVTENTSPYVHSSDWVAIISDSDPNSEYVKIVGGSSPKEALDKAKERINENDK